MARPTASADEMQLLLPMLDSVAPPFPATGQKLVFPCSMEGARYVLKVVECFKDEDAEDGTFARVQREVAVLSSCNCPHLPKLGPLGLISLDRGANFYGVFTEEFIDGSSLEQILEAGALPVEEVIRMAGQLALAITALWEQRKIHRDVKPANIMRRHSNGSYVLLDPGIAYDLDDTSLTGPGLIPHTRGYLAPESANPFAKRDADVRSDLFLLGVVLYYASTGVHPFIQSPTQPREAVVANILNLSPPAPVQIRNEIGEALSNIILRLLEKKKHLRFKSCDQLISELDSLRGN